MPWWRHDMNTLAPLLALCKGMLQSPMDIHHKGQEMKGFDGPFVVSLNKLVNKQSRHRWIETPWCSYDVTKMVKSIVSFIVASTKNY